MLRSELQPNIEPILDYLLIDLQHAYGGQQGMNRLSHYITELLDTKLHHLLLQSLAKAAPVDRTSILRGHLEWTERRKTDSQAAVESHGGSLAPLEYHLAYKIITEQRIQLLQTSR
jgi:uncharacterized protein YecT (DUF1311 family)